MKKTHPLNHLTNYLEKYLKSYAEKKIDALVESISASLHSHQFDHCLIIPTYNEPHDFIESLITKLNNKVWSSVLIILVINQPDTDDNITPNQEFWLKFKAFKVKNSHRIMLKHYCFGLFYPRAETSQKKRGWSCTKNWM
jgi:cellulose synthase/poly-beta-1,6-N-acetylglucosamine synthase-like glycosyltransferase